MLSNFKIASVFGIDIELHISFILFILLFLVLDWTFIPILVVLFTSITLHELSHSLVGKMNGIKVKKIVLLPIGGMAAMDEGPIKPYSEFKMSIAGPLFNYAFCALLLFFVWVFNLPFFLGWADWNLVLSGAVTVPLITTIVSSAFWLNWLLGSFNLFVPAIPLDGGRVFRSALALVTDYVQATRIATTVSTVITFVLFLYALFTYNIILLVISIFVYLGAVSELDYALSNKLLAHFPLAKLVRTNYITLPPDTRITRALDKMLSSRSPVVFIKSGDGMAVTSIYDIRHVPRAKWKNITLKKASNLVDPVSIDHPLTQVLRLMTQNNLEAIPIAKKGRIIGVVFKEDIDHVFEILKVSKA